ncbi:hypothetical protein KI387_001201, partial [Taxus chinensis]
ELIIATKNLLNYQQVVVVSCDGDDGASTTIHIELDEESGDEETSPTLNGYVSNDDCHFVDGLNPLDMKPERQNSYNCPPSSCSLYMALFIKYYFKALYQFLFYLFLHWYQSDACDLEEYLTKKRITMAATTMMRLSLKFGSFAKIYRLAEPKCFSKGVSKKRSIKVSSG